MKVYLLNHPEFESRRNFITDRLHTEGINFEVVDKYCPDEIDYEGLTKNFHIYYQMIIEQVGRYSYYNYPKKISPGSLSLVLKHIHCWRDQIENQFDEILVLEDDCEIPKDFNILIEKVMEEKYKNKYDIVMLGGYTDFVSPNIIEGNLIHYHPNQKTRCTHAYVINKESARIMIDGFSNINNPIDIKMNEVIQLNKLKIAWLEPGLRQIDY